MSKSDPISDETEKALESGNKTINGPGALNKETETKRKEIPGIQGFEIVYGAVCLLGAFLCREK
jgi:hypothetical protein